MSVKLDYKDTVKRKTFYWVVAEMLAQRDGKYLENRYLQSNTNPATIDLNLDSAVRWLHDGAQPTDTAKAILSYKGLLKHHGGIRKGALTQEQADAKLAAWLEAKSGTVDAKKDGLTKRKLMLKLKLSKKQDVNAKRLAAAAKVEADAIALPLLLLKKLLKSLKLKLQLKILQKKTTKKLKHKFISEDA
jgi:small subunit ribosomal protein S16